MNKVDKELIEMICGKRPSQKVSGSLNLFSEVSGPNSLCPVSGPGPSSSSSPTSNGTIDPSKWEQLLAVVDSGATVPVLHPKTGRGYEVEESPASRAGVEYETAGGDTLANLGQKQMAVMTEEGTLRGYSTQCADVTKALQSVRALVNSKHAVCFGLGPEGEDHLIINRVSGEINRMVDDGINYLQKLLIIPPDQLNALMQAMSQGDPGNPEDFPRHGA